MVSLRNLITALMCTAAGMAALYALGTGTLATASGIDDLAVFIITWTAGGSAVGWQAYRVIAEYREYRARWRERREARRAIRNGEVPSIGGLLLMRRGEAVELENL